MGTCTLMIRHLKKLKTLKFPKFVNTELERFMYVTQLMRLPKTQENKTLKRYPFERH